MSEENKFASSFDNNVKKYEIEFGDSYMGITGPKLLDEFYEYCEALRKVDIETAKEIIDLGNKYCEERLKTHYDGDASWIIMFHLKLEEQIEDFIPVKDKQLRNRLKRIISAPQSKRFTHNPGVSTDITDRAYHEWWELQKTKHRLASHYLDYIRSQTGNGNSSNAAKLYDASNTSEKKNSMAEIVAREIKERTKSHDDTYSKDDILFVVKFAEKNRDENNISELVRTIRKQPDCPKILKEKGFHKGVDTKPERRWIKHFDSKAGISRTA
jgi:hypothetical protein